MNDDLNGDVCGS